MFIMQIKGPVSADAIRRLSNDLGGALFAPFNEGEQGTWVGGVNDHFTDGALEIANRHGLTVLGISISYGDEHANYRHGLAEPRFQLLGRRQQDSRR
jgi:hypothetical protein